MVRVRVRVRVRIFELTILRFIEKEVSLPISSGVYSWNTYCQVPVS